MDKIVVLITASGEEEAATIGRALVEERLAACVNIVSNVRSIYRWKDAIADDRECMLVVKTSAMNFGALEARVLELHSYELPEIIALPVAMGHEPYLAWVTESTLLG